MAGSLQEPCELGKVGHVRKNYPAGMGKSRGQWGEIGVRRGKFKAPILVSPPRAEGNSSVPAPCSARSKCGVLPATVRRLDCQFTRTATSLLSRNVINVPCRSST